jgi:hypothetical protein
LGFNALLPAPKRTGLIKGGSEKNDNLPAMSGKVFSLKTSAAPGFNRDADAEMFRDQTMHASKESLVAGNAGDVPAPSQSQGEEIAAKKKGNAMMFKPLSVARNKTKKQPNQPELVFSVKAAPNNKPAAPATVPELKPKVSLFGLSRDEKPTKPQEPVAEYKPLIYNAADSDIGPQPPPNLAEDTSPLASPPPSVTDSSLTGPQTLTSIANDLNLSRSELRQLFGRQSAQSGTDPSHTDPKVLTFDTDAEYRSNAAYLASTTESERAAQQHNPVRSIAPGKHSLRQLVNAVSNQRDALEESFASGKRNRKEAGSKYGW